MAIIIKGKSISGSKHSRDHFLRGKENDKIVVLQVTGFATKDADEAIEMIQLSAKGTKCEKPIYSAKINPEPDRVWTRQEMHSAITKLEENLGLKGHARIVIEHSKKGRVHYHVLWSRFPPQGGPAKNMGNDYSVHQKTQNELVKKFKLRPMRARGTDFKHWEVEWAKRYGFDIVQIRAELSSAFNQASSGQDFLNSCSKLGIVLCRGNKSQFVVVLPWGQHKGLSRFLLGRPTKSILRRALGDIDTSALPSIEEGKAIVRGRLRPRPRKTRKKGQNNLSWIVKKDRTRPAQQKRPKHRPLTGKNTFVPLALHNQGRLPTTASDYAGAIIVDDSPLPPRKKRGKAGEGKNGGATLSANNQDEQISRNLDIGKDDRSHLSENGSQRHPRKTDPSHRSDNGPQRRQRNFWVPVERRQTKFSPDG